MDLIDDHFKKEIIYNLLNKTDRLDLYDANQIITKIDLVKSGKKVADSSIKIFYEYYEETLKSLNKIDYTDQIILFNLLCLNNNKVRMKIEGLL